MKNLTRVLFAAEAAVFLMSGCGGGAAANSPKSAGTTAEASTENETGAEASTENETGAEATESAEAATEPAETTKSAETTEPAEATEPAETTGSADSTEALSPGTVSGETPGLAYDDPKSLPPYTYQGTQEYMDVIGDYLVAEHEEMQADDTIDVYIPFGNIVKLDDTNPDDIIAYGSFNINGFNLLNTTLFAANGSWNHGAVHLKKNDDGSAVVTKAELPETDMESKKILSAVDGLYEQVIKEDESKMDQIFEEAIASYINTNGLNITQWQNYGRAPKRVLNAPDTPEEAQFYRKRSPLGYELTIDLREFSFSNDGVNDMYGKVEKNDTWTGTLMVVGKTEGDDTDAAISEALSNTDASGLTAADYSIGDSIPCKRAEYDEKIEDGRIFRYVCYAVPAKEGVLTVLIETTVEKGVSELSVAELEKTFESTLQTFKLL